MTKMTDLEDEKPTELLPEDPGSLLAHDLSKKARSADVQLEGRDFNMDFSKFDLSEETLQGLAQCGFLKPSPIQSRALPIGKCGVDLLMQAKSGTGKTLVFSIIILERVSSGNNFIQALVLAPSREIAYQSTEVLKLVGAFKELRIENYIGGLPILGDVTRQTDTQVAVGTPGRIRHLITSHSMDLSNVNLLVLDEADKLLESPFFQDILFIKNSLSEDVQIIASSATYPEGMDEFVVKLMRNPHKIELNKTMPVLLAINHFALDSRRMNKVKGKLNGEEHFNVAYKSLKGILASVEFTRAAIFCNLQMRAESVYDKLKAEGISVVLLSGALPQRERIKSFREIWGRRTKILVATDLAARGIDCEDMDLVVNFDCPTDLATYVHRSGRAGRFGSRGISITLLSGGRDYSVLTAFQDSLGFPLRFIDSVEKLGMISKGENVIQKLGLLKRDQEEEITSTVDAESDHSALTYLQNRPPSSHLSLLELQSTSIMITTDVRSICEGLTQKGGRLGNLREEIRARRLAAEERQAFKGVVDEEDEDSDLSDHFSDLSTSEAYGNSNVNQYNVLQIKDMGHSSIKTKDRDITRGNSYKIGERTERVLSQGIRGGRSARRTLKD